ncbi:calpain C [Dermacentor variabilis]|uniref:calpain C n=1 Tax=Dermacentor variabilis TaxID=34621 RepID=UPI003F5CA290
MSELEKIKKSLLKCANGDGPALFEDPDFPASQNSVFYHQTPPFKFTWLRPKEICSSPQFVSDGPSQFDITPGKLGDRWFVSCLGVLATCRGLFYRVVPADQGFGEADEYVGLFRFRLWWCGDWKEVIIDDRLPTVNGKLVFVQSGHGSLFWAALLEKAYAKLYGSYEALKYGSSVDGLADLTGGVTETLNIREDPSGCARTLAGSLLARTTLVTAVVQQQHTQSRTSPEKMANGICLGTNYRILAFQKVTTAGGEQVQLVKLRNPFGVGADYIGSWSLESQEWDKVPPEEQERLNYKSPAEGEFWMSYQDFMKTFTSLEVAHLDSETSRDELSLRDKTPWQMKVWKGHWQKGVTAGGCRNNTDTFHINPQFQLILSESEEVVISLSQDAVIEPKVMGFTIYQTPKPPNDALDKAFFKKNKSLLSSQYSNCKQVSVRCVLEQGGYVLLPTTFELGQEASFTLRVFSGKPTKLKLIDSQPSTVKPAIMKAPPSFDSKISSYEAVFLQVADEHSSVNCFELQELLEACLPNDYVKSCATLEVCRQVVMALDTTGMGRLRYQEYKNFMCSLKYWQSTFKKHTRGTAGILRAEKLRDAIVDVGFQLNTEILSMLMLRYMRKDGTLRFGDFVSCILHLSVAFATFEKKDPLQNGFIKMTLAEWLKTSLQC